MIVNAQIFMGNMSAAKKKALMSLTRDELFKLTGFVVVPTVTAGNDPSYSACSADDCLATWSITISRDSPVRLSCGKTSLQPSSISWTM